MSLSRRLQPLLTRTLTHARTHALHRGARERVRRLRQRPHEVTFYHRADDPWSYLLAQALPRFLKNFPGVALRCRTLSAPGPGAIPRPDLYASYGLTDARRLAPWFGLLPPEHTPAPRSVEAAHGHLVGLEETPHAYLEAAASLGEQLFAGQDIEGAAAPTEKLESNARELHRRGHYLPGVLHYEGEWYWGIDRLLWLEERLALLGVGHGHTLERRRLTLEPGEIHTLEAYVSVRSPYSYLALERVWQLRERHGIEVDLKPVLPMVKRGFAVPASKRIYIVFDANRVAERLGIPFGTICDPLPATERVLAVFFSLKDPEQRFAWLRETCTAAWSRGVDLMHNKALYRAGELAGVEASAVDAGLRDERWQERTTRHREELEDMGLWGVPSFRWGNEVWWGQDRLWMVEEALTRSSPAR